MGCLGSLAGIALAFAGSTIVRNGSGEIAWIDLTTAAVIGIVLAAVGIGTHAVGHLGGWRYHG
jgi:hypothetical protein